MRAFLIILDGVGIGALPDAGKFGDEKSNTLGNLSLYFGGINLPWFYKLGLGNLLEIKGIPSNTAPLASYGNMSLFSPGKDTTTGHWEIAGIIKEDPFPVFKNGFPKKIVAQFEHLIGRSTLGNKAASGTQIIKELGEEHCATGYPIIYTSADSVFQVAAHEKIIPLEKLYNWCEKARKTIFTAEYEVGRIIARPFLGSQGKFYRTKNRKDFSVKPPLPNILTYLVEKRHSVISIGKVYDIFAGEGITDHFPASGNKNVVKEIFRALEAVNEGLVFANLNDFDTLYGHRNDPEGFYKAIRAFDDIIPKLLYHLGEKDILIITADHGCDPTHPGTDHTREFVPLFVTGPSLEITNLGCRKSYADVAQSIAWWFNYNNFPTGNNFIPLNKRME